jgi:hypothetical protein
VAKGVNLTPVDSMGGPLAASVVTDALGNASLDLPSNAYASWEVSGEGCPDSCVPTYAFNVHTLALDEVQTGGVEQAIGWDIDDTSSLIQVALPIEGAPFELIGTMRDCALQPAANVQVVATDANGTTAMECNPHGLPCLVYLNDAGRPDLSLKATGRTGTFAVLQAATPVTLRAYGMVDGNATATELGSATVPVFAESMSLANVYPH